MDDNNVIPFCPPKLCEKVKKIDKLGPRDVEFIGFITHDDQDYYIEDQRDIARVFAFLVKEGIKLRKEQIADD